MPVKIEGLDALRTRMRDLTTKESDKIFKAATRKSSLVFRDRARLNAQGIDDPKTRESIAKNIVSAFSSRTFRRTGNIMFRVGVLGGAKTYSNTKANVRSGKAGKTYKTDGDKGNPGGDTFYWRFVEFGTKARKPRTNSKGRKLRGHPGSRPRRFMTSAMLSEQDKALSVFAAEANMQLDRLLRKK